MDILKFRIGPPLCSLTRICGGPMGPPWAHGSPRGAHWFPRAPMGPLGGPWVPWAHPGNPWAPLGSHGTPPWGPRRIFVTTRETVKNVQVRRKTSKMPSRHPQKPTRPPPRAFKYVQHAPREAPKPIYFHVCFIQGFCFPGSFWGYVGPTWLPKRVKGLQQKLSRAFKIPPRAPKMPTRASKYVQDAPAGS